MSAPELHSFPLPSPDHWWACARPERPYDATHTWFEERCRACVLALGAAAHADPDGPIFWHTGDSAGSLIDVYEHMAVPFGLPSPVGAR